MTTHRTIENRTVAEMMTRDLLTIAADESVLMAWELMCQAGIHHLPVTDDGGGFIGVVDAQTLTTRWNAAGPEHARQPVTTLLPPNPPAPVRPTALVPQAARTMLKSDKDYVPVTDDRNVLVGLLTARDLITALAGVHRDIPPRKGGMPSLYRIKPVLPSEAPAHPGQSPMGPD